MTIMGLGLVPLDEAMIPVAAPFIDPFGIPMKGFLLVLGPCKILGVLALWGIGPMPEWIARLGLSLSATCAVYGHHSVGESVVPPLGYLALMGGLYALDSQGKGKSE